MAPSLLKLVNTGTQATGITLIATNDFGAGIVAGSAHGGPGVRGIALGCGDGYRFGVEGIGGGGVRGEAVIGGSGTNTSDFQYGVPGLVGASDSGTAVWARSGSGLALLAESDGRPALRAIGHAIAAALHATNSADGSAGSLATAITAHTGGNNNAAAVHARAGVSGLALPNLGGVIGESSSEVGVTGLSDTGVRVMAQAGGGMAVKAESTSSIALQAVAHSSSGTIVSSNTASGDAVYIQISDATQSCTC